MQAPTPENYKEWYNARLMRTSEVISKQVRISGRQVKDENLSVRLIYDSGYTYDSVNDMLERNNG